MNIRMTGQDQNAASACDISLPPLAVGLSLLILSVAMVMAAPLAQAQTFQVLHAFTGGGDDATPVAGLTVAAPGKLYGTTSGKAIGSNGLVFQLTSAGTGWTLNPLNDFGRSGSGPSESYSKLTIGPDGALYGTTYSGGVSEAGTVFRLQPPPRACTSFSCPWTLTILHAFNYEDGAGPLGAIVFDRAGNLYGVTSTGGGACADFSSGCGVVYELSPGGGGWTETVILNFNFDNGCDGAIPNGGLLSDAAGNLYGVTWMGGPSNSGVVYKLSSSQGGGWNCTALYSFADASDGGLPEGELIMDGADDLYGVTDAGGSANGGTVFQLSQQGQLLVLYNFPGGSNSVGTLVFDASGNLYGTTSQGGVDRYGTVFKLAASGASWIESDVHVFQPSDGTYPNGGIVLDSAGNLYGTAQIGGYFSEVCPQGCGTVWKITP
jgi:uncharacterized repeat protein (TIGR03803 family)